MTFLDKEKERPRQLLRAAILTLLVLGGIVNFLDRSALSIANTTMRSELGFSATQIGVVPTVSSDQAGVQLFGSF